MNPEQPSREQIEARITALLLGELPADEAALLRYTMTQDPALQKLHDELQATLVLVREAAKHPGEPPPEKAALLKLSAERREKLLAHFKTERTKATQGTQGTQAGREPLFWLKRIEVSPLVRVLALVAIIALLVAMLLPALSSAKRKEQRGTYGAHGLFDSLSSSLSDQSSSAENEKREALQANQVTPGQGQTLGQTTSPPQPAVAAPSSQPLQPLIVSLKPRPKLAPPPAPANAQIVLPQTESTSEVAAQTTAPVESQSIVGYVNVPISTPSASVPTTSKPSVAPPPEPAGIALPATTESDRLAMNSGVESASVTRATASHYGETPMSGVASAGQPDALALAQIDAERKREQEQYKENKGWFVPDTALSDSSGSTSKDALNNQNLGAVGGNINGFAGTSGFGGRIANSQSQMANGNTVVSGGIGGSGGGGGSTFYGRPASSPATPLPAGGIPSSTLALNDRGVNQRAGENLPPLQPAPPAPTAAAVPEQPIPGTGSEVATAELKTESAERHYRAAEVQTHGAAGLAGNTYYRNLSQKTEQEKVTTLSGAPVAGSLPSAGALALNEPAEVPPATPPPVQSPIPAGSAEYRIASGDTLSRIARENGVTLKALEDANPGVDPKKLRPGKKLTIPSSTASTTVARTPGADNLALGLAGDSYATGVAKDDIEHLRDLVTNGPQPVSGVPAHRFVSRYPYVVTNAVALNDGSQNTFNPGAAGITPDAAKALGRPMGEFPTKAEQEEMIPQDFINFQAANLDQVLDIYSKLANRTVLHGKLPQAEIVLTNHTPLTKAEAIEKLQSVMARNGVSLINIGDKYVKAVPSDEAGAAGQTAEQADLPLRKPAPNTPLPQPEILTRENNFSTFSLNVSDVSFKFTEASLQNGKLPDTASIRSEEFINAFDYRDPEAVEGQPMAFASERARYPFAHNRELLRFAIKTAAAGRQEGRALNLVLLLDNSGSMERADRVAIIREALRVLATQLQPQDMVSVVTFSRTARLWADGISGDKAGETLERVGGITPEGGTNLEEAMRLAYETAHRHYLANGMNRVVLLTDGAANLGNVDPNVLKQRVETQRKQGIALDCFGIGWEDYNDDLLEQLSSNGDGRYAFLNSPEDASKDFAAKLAGALQIAAADVKVQVEFNPQRVTSYRQIGYATHQLTKEQFRDNTVAAGQIAAQEAGNALYTIEVNPGGEGPIATVHVRYKVPGTDEYREHSWEVEYTGNAPALEQSSAAMRLAAVASAFSEWLAASPYAQEVTLDELLRYLSGVPQVYGADDRPQQLETMIREAKSLEGK